MEGIKTVDYFDEWKESPGITLAMEVMANGSISKDSIRIT